MQPTGAIGLLLAGSLFLLPFLIPYHQQPVLSFFPEWLAAALGIAATLAAAKAAAKKKSDEAALAGDELPDVEGDEALEEADELADDAEDIEVEGVEVEDDKGEGDR